MERDGEQTSEGHSLSNNAEDFDSQLNITSDSSGDEYISVDDGRFAAQAAERIAEGLQSPLGVFLMRDLLQVLQSILKVCRGASEDRSLERERQDVSKFVAELLHCCFQRLFQEEYRNCMDPHPLDVYHAIVQLIHITFVLQQQAVKAINDPSDSTEYLLLATSQDVGHCLYTLSLVFEQTASLYSWSASKKTVIAAIKSKHPQIPQEPSATCDWHTFFVSYYVGLGGVNLCKEMLELAHQWPLLIIEQILVVLDKASSVVAAEHQEACREVSLAIGSFQHYLLACIKKDHEQLADNGRDRTFMILSRILQHMYALEGQIMGDASYMQVCKVQREFVQEMLRSSNFNKLLSATRECHKMLEHSKRFLHLDQGALLRDNVLWLNQHNIIKQMLRANLHQRQYADLVLSILQVLTDHKMISEDHLDMLWAVTEQEGIFDVVKTNVYQMIEELAAGLTPEQLDLLFRKFEVSKGRSISDTLMLLDLLKKLATSDSKQAAYMAERLLDMIWQLSMPPDAPPELLQSNVIFDVLRQYDGIGHSYCQTYLQRCVEQLRNKQNTFTALHMLRSLLSIYNYGKLHESTLPDVVHQLDETFKLQELLVSNLQDFMNLARKWVAERHSVDSSSNAAAVVVRLPGQGPYSYQQMVGEYVNTILFLAVNHRRYFPRALAEQMWDMLVLHGVHPEDHLLGLSFCQSGACNEYQQYFDQETMKYMLMSKITALSPETLTNAAWQCFSDFFQKVNREDKRMVLRDVGEGAHAQVLDVLDLNLQGLPFVWSVALDCSRPDVTAQAMDLLLKVYTRAQQDDALTSFINECTKHLLSSAAALAGLPVHQVDWSSAVAHAGDPTANMHLEGASRRVCRSLVLLNRKLETKQGKTMPPVPSHRASYKGQQLMLEVQAQSPHMGGRFKVACHVNEYVGLVRRRIAQHIGCEPQQLRLLYAGDEWRNDTHLLIQAAQKPGGRQIVIATVSPQDNSYTEPPQGWREKWELASPIAMLSRMDHIYDVLFFLADLPLSTDVRMEAVRTLQLLPTCSCIPAKLQQALADASPLNKLRTLLMEPLGPVQQPAKLLYTLQALHGVLFPVFPSDVGVAGSGTPATEDCSMAGTPTALAVTPTNATWVVSGCIPFLAEVVEQVMARASLDLNFLRELHSLIIYMVTNMISSTVHQVHSSPGHLAVPGGFSSSKAAPDSTSSCSEAQEQRGVAAAANGGDPMVPGTPAGAAPLLEANADGSSAMQEDDREATPVAVAAVGAMLRELDLSTLASMVSLLVRLAWDIARMWGVPCRDPDMALLDLELSPDVVMAREALGTLARLLDSYPKLYHAFLGDARSGSMVQEVLLNQHYPHMRTSCEELLCKMCLMPATPEAHLWLLQLLCNTRAQAHQVPHISTEYYQLFVKAVDSINSIGTPQAYSLAEELLQEEVASLHDVATMVLANYVAALQGKLQLIHTLVKSLDKASVGASRRSQPGIIQLLLTQYLFPEGTVISRVDAEPYEMEQALDVCCRDPGCRKAAMDLVAQLMIDSASNMEDGSAILHDLHYRSGPLVLTRDHLADQLRPAGGYVGLRNGGATCYMNAILQQLFMQPQIRELVLGAKPVPPLEQADSVFHQLQVLFAHLCLSRGGSHHPRPFWNAFKDYDGSPIDVKEHQDAYEFFTRLQDFVDQHLRSTNQTPAMQHVMGGRFAQQVICKDLPYRSEREEEFYQISVDVKGKGSLEKSLESYVQGELMEGENAYFCEQTQSGVTAVRRTCIKELPQTLVVHLKRFEYDHINMTRYKVRERFEFPTTLDIFKYTADGLAALEGSAAQVAQQPDAKPRNYYIYELKGIVVHSGTAFAGHYYSYIKERPKVSAQGQVSDGQWFMFDDKVVRPWDLSQLDQDCFGGRSSHSQQRDSERAFSAYMLFYERKDGTSFERCSVRPQLLSKQNASAETSAGSNAATEAPLLVSEEAGSVPVTPSSGVAPMLISPKPLTAAEVAEAEAAANMAVDSSSWQQARSSINAAKECEATTRLAASSSGAVTPYGMPVELYEQVMRGNLSLMHKLHVFDKDYFKFIRQVVEMEWEHQKKGAKARRKEGPSNSGSSGRINSGVSESEGASDPASAPSQRGEDSEQAACQSIKLAVQFLCSLYLTAPQALRSDWLAWRELVLNLLSLGWRTCVTFAGTLVDNPAWLRFYMCNVPAECSSLFTAMLAAALERMALVLRKSLPSDPDYIHANNATTRLLVVIQSLIIPAVPDILHILLSSTFEVLSMYLELELPCVPMLARGPLPVQAAAMAHHLAERMLRLADADHTQDLHSIYNFIYMLLVHVPNLHELLPNVQCAGQQTCNPYVHKDTTVQVAVSPAFAAELLNESFLRGLTISPSMVADRTMTELIKMLTWQNGPASVAVLSGLLDMMDSNLDDDELDLLYDAIPPLLDVDDELHSQRVVAFCFGLQAPRIRVLGLADFLLSRNLPLKLLAWFLMCQQAGLHADVSSRLQAWMSTHKTAAIEMHRAAHMLLESQGVEGLVRERAQEVMTTIEALYNKGGENNPRPQ